MLNYAEDVIEFHNAMGLPLLYMPEDKLNANLPVRKRLIDEEVIREFLPAYQKYYQSTEGDGVVDVLDAICDSIYVLTGFCLAVDTCNEHQLLPKKYTTGLLDYEWSNEAAILTDLGYCYELMTDMQDAKKWKYTFAASPAASRVARRCISRFSDLGYLLTSKYELIWQEVHRTNMAKADGPVVNGKKMKPEGWCPPNIKAIMEGTV